MEWSWMMNVIIWLYWYKYHDKVHWWMKYYLKPLDESNRYTNDNVALHCNLVFRRHQYSGCNSLVSSREHNSFILKALLEQSNSLGLREATCLMRRPTVFLSKLIVEYDNRCLCVVRQNIETSRVWHKIWSWNYKCCSYRNASQYCGRTIYVS